MTEGDRLCPYCTGIMVYNSTTRLSPHTDIWECLKCRIVVEITER